jgi:hypothetical protein
MAEKGLICGAGFDASDAEAIYVERFGLLTYAGQEV